MPEGGAILKKKVILDLLRKAEEQKTSDYDEETVKAVLEAAGSDDYQLNEQAWLTVHQSLRAYEDDFLKKYGIYKTSTDYEDYVNELFIVIMTDLKKWNPSIGALTTHFKPRFTKACVNYRNIQNSTFSSTHYELVHADIKKALETLAQRGVYAPSTIEIRNEIASKKKAYSEQTIQNCMEQIKDISSIDANRDISDTAIQDPVMAIIESETKDEIMKVIEMLEPQHRLVMEVKYRIYRDGGADNKKMTTKMVADEVRRIAGTVNDEWVKNLCESANREFKHRYKNRHFNGRTNINYSPFLLDEYYQTGEDIRSAVAEDLESLFASEA